MNLRIGITVHAMSNTLPECEVADNAERKYTSEAVTCLACKLIVGTRLYA